MNELFAVSYVKPITLIFPVNKKVKEALKDKRETAM